MSVKEFFAYASIKQTVIEFLKVKADFASLSNRFKKPFRAHINKHLGTSGQGGNQASEADEDQLADYFVSDGFNSIRCAFSEDCRDLFSMTYPDSVKIPTIVNMLICVQSFRVELRAMNQLQPKGSSFSKNGGAGAPVDADLRAIKNLEVVMIIDELRVISFDRFGMKMPSSVAFDDQVRVHLGFLRHFLIKQLTWPQEFEMAPISELPLRYQNAANEEKSSYFPQSSVSNPGRFEGSRGKNGSGGPAYGQYSTSSKSGALNAINDYESVVQIRDDNDNGLKANRLRKQQSKALKKLRQGANLEGFLSCEGSQISDINALKGEAVTGLSKNEPGISASQIQRQEEELEAIDQFIEDMIEDDEEEDQEESGAQGKKQQKSFSPSEPILLSQKADLLQDALEKSRLDVNDESDQNLSADIEAILDVKEAQSAAEQVQIANNEEKISNSSTPLENEKLQRAASQRRQKNKIELNVEMTEEMKRQEQSINFGATPYSSKTVSVQNSVPVNGTDAQQNILGTGPQSLQRQREFIEFKKQGQQGVQNSPAAEQQDSQRDLLDLIEDPMSTVSQKQKSPAKSSQGKSAKKTNTKAGPVQGKSILDFFIKREGKKLGTVKATDTPKENKKVNPNSASGTKKDKVENPESEKSTLPKKRGVATRPRGATPTKKDATIKAPSPAKSSSAQEAKKVAASSSQTKTTTAIKGRPRRGAAAQHEASKDEPESIETSSQQVSQPASTRGAKKTTRAVSKPEPASKKPASRAASQTKVSKAKAPAEDLNSKKTTRASRSSARGKAAK